MVFGRWSGFGFQSSSSPIMEGVVDLHNHIFFFLVLVFVFVFWVFGNILYQFWWKVGSPAERPELLPLRKASHSTSLEVIWTLIPSFILVAIAVPSFALLYAMDEIMEPALTLKVVGHQWYWTYQYSNCLAGLRYSFVDHPEWVPQSLWDRVWFNALFFFEAYLTPVEGGVHTQVNTSAEPQSSLDLLWFTEYFNRKLIAGKVAEALGMQVDLSRVAARLPGVQFDSYMLNEEELPSSGDYRLLEVDEPVVLPANTQIRLLITADDVIHSFALPQLGIKVDAVPGRLNQQGLFIKREGTFYGQCSELCGVNHGFMPIVVKAVGSWEFMDWYIKKFDSLFPEYGFAMADPEEVRAFIETGAYPVKYADRFEASTLVDEPISGSKVDSLFDQTPTYKTPLFESYHNSLLNRLGLWHSVVLETNWGQVQVNPTGSYADHSYPETVRPGECGPIFGRTAAYDYWARTKDRPALVWGESPVYYQISTSRPMEYLNRYTLSDTDTVLMEVGQEQPLQLDCTAPNSGRS